MKKYLLLSFMFFLLVACSSDDNTSNPSPNNKADTVIIGSQTWMTKNLDVTTYSNGDAIPEVTNPTGWVGLTTGVWCHYNNDPANDAIYGKLYNWYAVNDSRGLAPEGWRVASDADWTTLTSYLGGLEVAGGKLKEAGTSHWASPNTGATNQSGFYALPGGWRMNANGTFYYINQSGNWWTATSGSNSAVAWSRYILNTDAKAYREEYSKENGFSVRCVKK